MSGALMNKVWDLFGMDTADQADDDYENEDVYGYDDEEERRKKIKNNSLEEKIIIAKL